ncbi:MAG: FAD-dependent oxidoreductase [Proteobacteria bacterium]|nr:FAD-dependent oxidoreductase [Pseudomonadota bacterium]
MESSVLVIGGGIAGLTVTHELAKLGIKVELVEKEPFLGGHAIQLTCKATESCAKCGACMVQEKLSNVICNENIIIHTGANLERISKNGRFIYNIQLNQNGTDKSKCTDYSSSADAVVMATGFEPFNPVKKPYGYKVFKNVITNLELEGILKINGNAVRPSDGAPPDKIAFIQCVGSRDSKLNHLWCSKICCASALRMARVIKTRKPETSVTFFYIDIQGSGKDFEALYEKAREDFRMIRAIPGDIYKTEDDRIKTSFFDCLSKKNIEEVYDMIVLSVAMIPGQGTKKLAEILGIIPCDTGFVGSCENNDIAGAGGVFVAGTAGGPLSIAESITHAVKTAWDVVKYIKTRDQGAKGSRGQEDYGD